MTSYFVSCGFIRAVFCPPLFQMKPCSRVLSCFSAFVCSTPPCEVSKMRNKSHAERQEVWLPPRNFRQRKFYSPLLQAQQVQSAPEAAALHERFNLCWYEEGVCRCDSVCEKFNVIDCGDVAEK